MSKNNRYTTETYCPQCLKRHKYFNLKIAHPKEFIKDDIHLVCPKCLKSYLIKLTFRKQYLRSIKNKVEIIKVGTFIKKRLLEIKEEIKPVEYLEL